MDGFGVVTAAGGPVMTVPAPGKAPCGMHTPPEAAPAVAGKRPGQK